MSPRAARRCPTPGCDERIPCPAHTPAPWEGSQRRASLPGNWTSVRAAVLARDPACQLAYLGKWPTSRGPAWCLEVSREVDHIGSPEDHSPSNLRGACTPCHRRRTQAQSAAAR